MRAQRRFLWAVAIFAMILIAGAITWRLASDRLLRWASTPTSAFADRPPPPPADYAEAAAWVARPDMPDDPARFVPEGYRIAPRPAAATFYVPPTAFFGRDRWNAPLDDAPTAERLALFTRMQASVFNGVSAIWAPRYRQATLGAFFRPGPDADAALELAYGDVARAFEAFLAAQPAGRPLILAGHSQGSLHLLRLVAERVAGTPVAERVVAVYAVGWPVTEADLAGLGMGACATREQAGCLLSWQSFAADADLAAILAEFADARRFSGAPVGEAAMLCRNPLTGDAEAAGPEANLGALADDGLRPRLAGARCGPRGLLLVDPPPRDFGRFVLPNGNFHAYDYSLFWANIRADAEARLGAFAGRVAEAAGAAGRTGRKG